MSKEATKRRLCNRVSDSAMCKKLWNCRQMKPGRLLNGGSLCVPMLYRELGGRSDANDVGRYPNSQRMIDSQTHPQIRGSQNSQRMIDNQTHPHTIRSQRITDNQTHPHTSRSPNSQRMIDYLTSQHQLVSKLSKDDRLSNINIPAGLKILKGLYTTKHKPHTSMSTTPSSIKNTFFWTKACATAHEQMMGCL